MLKNKNFKENGSFGVYISERVIKNKNLYKKGSFGVYISEGIYEI